MIQQTPIRSYKVKPMSPEMQAKIRRSLVESADLSERELHCPHCNHYIATLFSDASGHFKAKCGNCKNITIYNFGYFRRIRCRKVEQGTLQHQQRFR